jgi:hypothetical protein
MNNDKSGLTWQQQVEYQKINKWGRDFNLFFRLRRAKMARLRYKEYSSAGGVLDDC